MRIYNIETQTFPMRWGLQTAAWVGSAGQKFRQVIVPVRCRDEKEPDPERWAVYPSRSVRLS